ncbi:MAG: hypothetical protein HY321_17415 [Armatimonadetes bacterium]|nr:hypothetical protein [Armatimonadota bacterium]
MHPTRIILEAKRRSVENKLNPLPFELAVSLPLLGVMVGVFLFAGYLFFQILFRFLRDSPPFGTMLTERLLAMVFLAFLSMLVFSNVVTSLTTLYLSEELEFLIARPVAHVAVFFARFWESLLYSSSAFVVMGLPIFLSYGRVHEAPLWFYPAVLLFYAPFLLVPAAAGAMVTMLLARFFPARKTRAAFCALLVLLLGAMGAVVHVVGRGTLARLDATTSLNQIMDALRISEVPYLPNHWISRGIIAAAQGDARAAGFYLLVLLSTAAMGLQLCGWLAPVIYYPGWARTRESEERNNQIYSSILYYRVIYYVIEAVLRPVRRPARALFVKDLKSFWRDPAQWAQLLLLFGLLIIYVSNLRNARINLQDPFWQSVISFFNMGATCFVLATITSRFIFPMWSLEGRQFWVVGLAPLSRRQLMRQKTFAAALGILFLGETVMMYANYMLRVPALMLVLSGVTVACASVGLVCLAMGLGALFPNFREDNAARIASGAGGTLNVIISLLYVGVLIAVQTYPIHAILTGRVAHWHALRNELALAGGAFLLINALAIGLPIWLGLRAVDRMEL